MRTIPFSDGALSETMRILKQGGIVAHATETCYGFACDLSNIDAVQKLFAIKQRPLMHPVSALFASTDEAKKYVVWNDRADELAQQYLPGPLTLILPMHLDAPQQLFPMPVLSVVEGLPADRSPLIATLGIRISSSPVAQKLAEMYGNPISTTSANLHGQPNPYSAEDIVAQFANQEHQPALIIDSGTLTPTPPSTVIDCTKETLESKRQGEVKI